MPIIEGELLVEGTPSAVLRNRHARPQFLHRAAAYRQSQHMPKPEVSLGGYFFPAFCSAFMPLMSMISCRMASETFGFSNAARSTVNATFPSGSVKL